MLKPFLLLSAVMLFALTPAPAAQAQVSTPTPAASDSKNPAKPTPESQARAKKMYGFDCMMCHGDNGNGKTDVAAAMNLSLTDFSDPNALASKSDTDLFNVIKQGKGKMPAEGSRAKTDEIWNLVLYIRNLPKEHFAAPAVAPAPAPAPTQ